MGCHRHCQRLRHSESCAANVSLQTDGCGWIYDELLGAAGIRQRVSVWLGPLIRRESRWYHISESFAFCLLGRLGLRSKQQRSTITTAKRWHFRAYIDTPEPNFAAVLL